MATMVKAEVDDEVDSFIQSVQSQTGLNKADTVAFILDVTARENVHDGEVFMNMDIERHGENE